MTTIKTNEKISFAEFIKNHNGYKGWPIAVAEANKEVVAEYNKYIAKKSVVIPLAQPVQLPFWPDTARGVPNGFLRSALFGAVRRGKRASIQAEEIPCLTNISILFTGSRLDQADLDVWEQCLHIARQSGPLGGRVDFSGHSFLKAIGRDTGKSQHLWLDNVLHRLMTSVIEIKDGNRSYAGQLIHHWAKDEITRHHAIQINPAIAKLYSKDGWTAVQWEQRMALSKQPLAQWLHGFYLTHANPYPYKIETIHKLCGSENKQMSGFKRELIKELERICAITGWEYQIDKGLVSIKKNQTKVI